VSQVAADPTLRVACVQFRPRLGDVAANLEATCDLLAAARAQGADLVVFPELSLTGYFLKDLVPEVAIALDGPEVATLQRAADGLATLVGAVVETPDHLFHNTGLLVGDAGVLHLHRKLYLPTYGLFDEQRDLAPGNRIRGMTLRLPGRVPWRVGVLICEDLWHPSAPYALSRQGLDLLLCPSASPGQGVQGPDGPVGSAASYAAMTRTYAELFTTFLVYCNRVGYEDGVQFWGGSRVLGADGSLLAGPAPAEPVILMATVDRGALRRARIAYPLLRDERPALVAAALRETDGELPAGD